ncbi:hypothetical protein L209DRAFT_433571 [Thermothelomyces heterothallicus CBS 203.75]
MLARLARLRFRSLSFRSLRTRIPLLFFSFASETTELCWKPRRQLQVPRELRARHPVNAKQPSSGKLRPSHCSPHPLLPYSMTARLPAAENLPLPSITARRPVAPSKCCCQPERCALYYLLAHRVSSTSGGEVCSLGKRLTRPRSQS